MFANLLLMLMLAPSWHAKQALIKLLDMWCTELDIECNTEKTVCIDQRRTKTRYITDNFPNFTIDGCALNFVIQHMTQIPQLAHNLNDEEEEN